MFSWLMSSLSTGELQNIIAGFGWIFLIAAVSWASIEQPPKIGNFSLSPWVIGGLICIFIFGNLTPDKPEIAVICWPPLSAVIAGIPEFFDQNFQGRLPNTAARARIIILILSNLIISCWIQFYFVLQDWLVQYPTLLADNLNRSAFVSRWEAASQPATRGDLVLEIMEGQLKQQLDGKPWPQVERWLLDVPKQTAAMHERAKKQLPPAKEDVWWNFQSQISAAGAGYKLQLAMIWQGPISEPGKRQITLSCLINKVIYAEQNQLLPSPVGEVNCEPVKQELIKLNPPAIESFRSRHQA